MASRRNSSAVGGLETAGGVARPSPDLPSPAVRFSGDGQRIVFSAFGRKHDSGATIYAIKASGGKPRVLSDSLDPRTVTTGLSWQPLP